MDPDGSVEIHARAAQDEQVAVDAGGCRVERKAQRLPRRAGVERRGNSDQSLEWAAEKPTKRSVRNSPYWLGARVTACRDWNRPFSLSPFLSI